MMAGDAGLLPISLAAAFVAGVAGSLHCVAMCGGIAGALGMRARHAGAVPGCAFALALAHHLGRIGSYALIGGLCGAFGGALAHLFDLQKAAAVVRVLAGLLLLAVAMRVLAGWQLLAPLERLGGRLWGRILPLTRAVSAPGGLGGALLLGALWGWLPCGLVYSMVIFAATAANAPAGAAILAAFGLGTLPAMLGGSLWSAQVWRVTAARGMHRVAGGLLLVFGIATLLAPLRHAHH
jgi:sulfite exporter TauE/SafE